MKYFENQDTLKCSIDLTMWQQFCTAYDSNDKVLNPTYLNKLSVKSSKSGLSLSLSQVELYGKGQVRIRTRRGIYKT